MCGLDIDIAQGSANVSHGIRHRMSLTALDQNCREWRQSAIMQGVKDGLEVLAQTATCRVFQPTASPTF